ncbi:hypothetical protein [Paenibacillus sanguinis]|uniref:hypothetical protein n=1 Tax=Paenibacillus sanguinis TaxID=225906 RepID=UPI000362369F|nr:hypothetical protein [Paenibacillus sanguinis]
MNMKSVEMQIAVPRTGDAGRVQQDQQHRPILDQSMLSGQTVKNSELERQRSAGVDESAHNLNVRREGNGSGAQEHGEASPGDNDEEGEREHMAEHPYKGKHIDLSW